MKLLSSLYIGGEEHPIILAERGAGLSDQELMCNSGSLKA